MPFFYENHLANIWKIWYTVKQLDITKTCTFLQTELYPQCTIWHEQNEGMTGLKNYLCLKKIVVSL